MKRFVFLIVSMLCFGAYADTINIHWLNDDGTMYENTTCTVDGDLELPTPPTKTGYTFAGWELLPYTLIEYLESTGTQWIDTGVKQSDFVGNLIFQSAFQPSKQLCGDHLASIRGDDIYYPLLIRNGYYMTNIWGGGQEKNIAPQDYNKHTIVVKSSNGNVLFDDKEFSFGKSFASVPTNLIIFGNNNLETGMLRSCYKLYSLSLSTSDNILLRDFIPVLDGNGTPCLYDKVEKKFYYNAGTGDFIAGPVIGG